MAILPMPSRSTLPRCLRPLLVALLLPLLASCGTTPTVHSPVQKVTADEACLTLADPLPQMPDPSIETLVRTLARVAGQYHELAARHRCLAEFERGR